MLLITLSVILFIAWLVKRKNQMSLLKRCGIPGPTPHFIFGNSSEIEKYGRVECHRRWYKEFGPIVGFYEGGYPSVLIADAEVCRQIQVKDFDKFSNRPEAPKGGVAPGLVRQSLVLINGPRWITQRKLMGPNFTTLKLKNLVPIITEIVEDYFEEHLQPRLKTGQDVEWSRIMARLTWEITSRMSFGVTENNPDDPGFDAFHNFTRDTFDSEFISKLFLNFPEFGFLLYPLRETYINLQLWLNKRPLARCDSYAIKTVTKRLESGVRQEDLLQYLIDANNEMSGMNGDGTTRKKQKRTLNDIEVVANTVGFLLAGSETSSMALTCIVHELTQRSDLQQKIVSEFEEAGCDPSVKMPMTEAIILEALRLYPQAPNFVQREALIDYDLGNGMTIPKGTGISIGVAPMHYDSKYWTDPETFNPERFLKDSQSENYAYQAFGAGPRMCIGMRLAFLMMKITLSRLLSKYRPVAGPKSTSGRLEVLERYFVICCKNGVWTKLVTSNEAEMENNRNQL